MILPTVGRVVWYHPSQLDPGIPPGDQPLAALVTHVWSDRMVNLAVFSSEGVPFPRTIVRLVQEGDEAPLELGQAEWMPFQIGQAKRHEAPVTPAPVHADGTAFDPGERIEALERSLGDMSARVAQLGDDIAAAASAKSAPDAVDGSSPTGDGADPAPTKATTKLKLPEAPK